MSSNDTFPSSFNCKMIDAVINFPTLAHQKSLVWESGSTPKSDDQNPCCGLQTAIEARLASVLLSTKPENMSSNLPASSGDKARCVSIVVKGSFCNEIGARRLGPSYAEVCIQSLAGSESEVAHPVMVIDVPDPSRPTVWIGHAGGSPNAKALLIYDVEREVFMALVLNTQASAEALANALLKEFDNEAY